MAEEKHLRIVRATRNRLLYITDTLMQDDRPDVDLDELKTYRQALREITSQTITVNSDDMPELTWPAKPNCVKAVEGNFYPYPKSELSKNALLGNWSPPKS